MPDKEMTDELELKALEYAIEDLMEDLERLQEDHRARTGQNYMPPLRLAPRKRKEADNA